MLKAAVIGVGSMGHHHARIYREMNDVELVTIVDKNPETASKVAARFQVPYYTDIDAMLAECKPDIVSLAVPTSLHYSVGVHLMEHGINVLIEKPIAKTLEEGAKLIEVAERNGVTLAV